MGLTPPRSPCNRGGLGVALAPTVRHTGKQTGIIMNTYKFRNSQGCILATITAKSSRSAWVKFHKTWHGGPADGVTCEDHGPAEA